MIKQEILKEGKQVLTELYKFKFKEKINIDKEIINKSDNLLFLQYKSKKSPTTSYNILNTVIFECGGVNEIMDHAQDYLAYAGDAEIEQAKRDLNDLKDLLKILENGGK